MYSKSFRTLFLLRSSFLQLSFLDRGCFLLQLITSAPTPRRPRACGGASTHVTRRLMEISRSCSLSSASNPGNIYSKVYITCSKHKIRVLKTIAPRILMQYSVYCWLMAISSRRFTAWVQCTDSWTKCLFSSRTY